MRTLVGVVGYRNLSDLSIGPALLPHLQSVPWRSGVELEDLSYGPIAVVQNLEDRAPYDRMAFVSGCQRGRPAGYIDKYEWCRPLPPVDEIQRRIEEAITGVISLDNLLVIAQYFKVLAPSVLVVDIEPVLHESGEALSASVEKSIPEILNSVEAWVHA